MNSGLCLGLDAEIHIDVERVVVRLEGAGVRADLEGQQDGGIHLHIPVRIEVRAHGGDDLRAAEEGLAHVLVHDEVDVAETVLHIDVLQPVVLFGQRLQRLGEHFKMRQMDAHFARLGQKDGAARADDVADVVVLFIGGIHVLAHVLTGDIELDVAVPIADVREGRLAHDAAAHQPARDGHFLPFERGEIALDLIRTGGHVVFGLAVGVVPLRGEFCKLFPADARLLGKFFRLRFGR